MRKKIFEQLAKKNGIAAADPSPVGYAPDTALPGELAFYLNDLINNVALKINREPSEVFAEVIEGGLADWYENQTAKTLDIIGLDYATLSPSVAPSKPVLAPVASPEEDEIDESDPDPASAQRAADAYMADTFNYTPMTLHSIGNGNGKKGGDNQTGRPRQQQRKRRTNNSGGAGGAGDGQASGGMRSNNRRRRPRSR